MLYISFFYSICSWGQENKNISFLDNWFSDTLVTNSSTVRFSGCWGFSKNSEEYAIIGSTEGTHFFHLASSNKLIPCGFVEGKYNSPQVVHREFKTFGNYAYSICDEGTSSLQIIDLSFLPDSVVKVADIQDINFGKVHNLYIDTTNALLYACLVTPIVGGTPLARVPMRVFSLANPISPVLLWEGPSDIPEVHDCYVRDNKAFLNCGTDGLRVYDFTNPSAPIYLSNLSFYQDQGYNHQGWLSPDGKTYLFADETSGKRVKKCSVGNDFSIQVNQLFGTNYLNNSIPHNMTCTDDFAFVAYYNEGLRIYDIRSNPIEVASYDTYTLDSPFKMNGAWGVHNFESGRVIVSDRQFGLFLFYFDQTVLLNPASSEFSLYPNPALESNNFIIRSGEDKITTFEIYMYDEIGEILNYQKIENQSFYQFDAPKTSGMYQIKIVFENYLGEAETIYKKLVIQ